MKIVWEKWYKFFNRPLTINQAQFYALSCMKPLERILGKGINNQMYVLKGNNTDGYFFKKEWDEFNQFIFNNRFNNGKFLKTLNYKILKDSKKIEEFFFSFKKIEFSKLNNKELLDIFKKTRKVLNTDVAYLWVGFVLEEVAEKKLLSIIKKYNLPTEESIDIIGSIEKPNHIIQEQLDLMKIIIKNKDIDKELNRHWLKYKYIPCYSVGVKPYSLAYFKNRIKKLNPKKAQDIVNKTKNDFKNNRKRFNSLMKKYPFSKIDSLFIKYYHEFTFLKDYRSHFRSVAMFYYKYLLQEIANRFKFSLYDVSLMLNQEIASLLINKKNVVKIKEIVKERKEKGCTYILYNGKESVLVGKVDELRNKSSKEIQLLGSSGNKGIAVGKVKIVLHPDYINKVKKGDVLVATMTRPDYIIAMEKASAIITDEGGLLCHAAIVSREMNKPCIIGTKIATKVLKDGDLVEVDANKGIVRIIK